MEKVGSTKEVLRKERWASAGAFERSIVARAGTTGMAILIIFIYSLDGETVFNLEVANYLVYM